MSPRSPPAGSSKVTVPRSPLYSTVQQLPASAVTADSSSSPHPIQPPAAYASDDDEPLQAVTALGSSRKGHRTRPSTTGLLQNRDDAGTTSFAGLTERQRRLRSYGEEEDHYGAGGPLRKVLAPVRGAAGCVKKNEGLLLIAFAQVFFASMNTCVKLLLEEDDMPVWELILIRMGVTFAGCYVYLSWTGDPHPFLGPPGVRFLLCLRGVIGFFGLFPGYFALSYLDLTDATSISFLAPVLVGVLAWIFLREPYSKLEAGVGLTSLLAVLLIAKPHFLFSSSTVDVPPGEGGDQVTEEQRVFAVGVALIGVCGAAGAYLLIRKIGKRASPMHSISYFSSLCVIVSSAYPFIFHDPPVIKFEQRFLLLIVPIGVFGLLAQILLTMGLQREKAGRGTLAVCTFLASITLIHLVSSLPPPLSFVRPLSVYIFYSVPSADSNLIFAMLLERLVFRKTPDPWSLLGAAIIVGGAVRVALEKKPVASVTTTTTSSGSVPSARRGSGASVLSVDPARAAEEGRKVKLAGDRGMDEERPLRLSRDGEESDDELEAGGEQAGGSGIAAARGLDVER